ncbi:hypothetical protein MSIMFI_01342 [Mycobacterium simulans]|nr:hypothetical protein MSIMFI_01342 [Mycobacterium simulans]
MGARTDAVGVPVGAVLSRLVWAAVADLALEEAERQVHVAGPLEQVGAPCRNLRTAQRAGARQGCRVGRAAPGPAGIHRARSWAPQVTGN